MYTLEFLFDDTLSFILPDDFETIYTTSTQEEAIKLYYQKIKEIENIGDYWFISTENLIDFMDEDLTYSGVNSLIYYDESNTDLFDSRADNESIKKMKDIMEVGFDKLKSLIQKLPGGDYRKGALNTLNESYVEDADITKDIKPDSKDKTVKVVIKERPDPIPEKSYDIRRLFKTKTGKHLKENQVRVIRKFDTGDKGLFINHSTGSGKTITACACIKLFLRKNGDDRNRKVIIVCPKTVKEVFRNTLNTEYDLSGEPIEIYTYDAIARHVNEIDSYNALVVLDECHTICNQKIKKTMAVYKLCQHSKFTLLLSATPFRNKLSDFISYIELLTKTKNKLKVAETEKMQLILDSLRGKFDYYDIQEDPELSKFYPGVRVDTKKYTSSSLYDKLYRNFTEGVIIKKIEPPSSSFLFSDRVGSNEIYESYFEAYNKYKSNILTRDTEQYYNIKLQMIVVDFLTNLNKTVIFTNWITSGVEIIQTYFNSVRENLKRGKIPSFIRPLVPTLKTKIRSGKIYKLIPQNLLVIAGDTSEGNRRDIINTFNESDKLTDEWKNDYPTHNYVLIITKAASEGMSLLGTRYLYVLDPVWNWASIKQIIGRVSRLNSHGYLPESERFVNIYFLIYQFKDTGDDKKSGDEMLWDIIDLKRQLSEDITTELKKIE